MPLHRDISRIGDDSKGDHAWIVTVQCKGERCVRPFSDGVYDGKEEALAAALAHRDLLLSGHSKSEQNPGYARALDETTDPVPGVGPGTRRLAIAKPGTVWPSCSPLGSMSIAVVVSAASSRFFTMVRSKPSSWPLPSVDVSCFVRALKDTQP